MEIVHVSGGHGVCATKLRLLRSCGGLRGVRNFAGTCRRSSVETHGKGRWRARVQVFTDLCATGTGGYEMATGRIPRRGSYYRDENAVSTQTAVVTTNDDGAIECDTAYTHAANALNTKMLVTNNNNNNKYGIATAQGRPTVATVWPAARFPPVSVTRTHWPVRRPLITRRLGATSKTIIVLTGYTRGRQLACALTGSRQSCREKRNRHGRG